MGKVFSKADVTMTFSGTDAATLRQRLEPLLQRHSVPKGGIWSLPDQMRQSDNPSLECAWFHALAHFGSSVPLSYGRTRLEYFEELSSRNTFIFRPWESHGTVQLVLDEGATKTTLYIGGMIGYSSVLPLQPQAFAQYTSDAADKLSQFLWTRDSILGVNEMPCHTLYVQAIVRARALRRDFPGVRIVRNRDAQFPATSQEQLRDHIGHMIPWVKDRIAPKTHIAFEIYSGAGTWFARRLQAIQVSSSVSRDGKKIVEISLGKTLQRARKCVRDIDVVLNELALAHRPRITACPNSNCNFNAMNPNIVKCPECGAARVKL